MRSKRPSVTFVYVLYTCVAESGRHDSKFTRLRRVREYGRGLMFNAALLYSRMPEADMVVYVPATELEAARDATAEEPDDVALADVLKALRKWTRVEVRPFGTEDVGGVNGNMPLGQRLRCARYLPLFAGPAGEPLSRAHVVRDADSIMTPHDVRVVRAWAAGSAQHIVYQEYMMGALLPMGGGLGCKVSWGPPSSLRKAIAEEACDESALTQVMPADLRAELTARSHDEFWGERSAKHRRATVFGRRGLVYVRTRLANNGNYYAWSPAGGGQLLWGCTTPLGGVQRVERGTPLWAR